MIALVGPTVSVGEQDLWASLTVLGQAGPVDFAAAEAQVRAAGPSGFDPLASIRALRVPALWLFGGNDLNIPTELCVERLDPLVREQGRDFAYQVFPKASHGLLESAHALPAELDRSSHYPAALFATIDDWLGAHGLRR